MELRRIKASLGKTITFSDIHFGVNKNSVKRLEIAEKFVKHLSDYASQNNIKSCIFNGDLYHNRNSLDLNVLMRSVDAIEKLADIFTDGLYLIVGNHDSFFKQSLDVHSLYHFKNTGNVHIIDEPTIIESNGSNLFLVPWGFDPAKYETKANMMFGHFEPSNCLFNGSTLSDGPYTIENLCDTAPLVFSGHYHVRKEYHVRNGTMVMVGSPFQMNYGECGNSNGWYVIDPQTEKYEFVENTISPKFWKVKLSTVLAQDKESLKTTPFKNNHIRMIIDTDCPYDKIAKIKTAIESAGCLECDVEFLFSGVDAKVDLSAIENQSNGTMKTNFEYTVDYINALKLDDGIKTELTTMMKNYFEAAELNVRQQQ